MTTIKERSTDIMEYKYCGTGELEGLILESAQRGEDEMKCKIFTEGNDGPEALQRRINDFFKTHEIIEITSTNTVVEKVDGISYLTVVIFYSYGD